MHNPLSRLDLILLTLRALTQDFPLEAMLDRYEAAS